MTSQPARRNPVRLNRTNPAAGSSDSSMKPPSKILLRSSASSPGITRTPDPSDLLQVQPPKSGTPTRSASVSNKNSVGNQYSASKFTRLDDNLSDTKPGTEHWLWERKTMKLGCYKIETVDANAVPSYKLYEQINSMVDLYDELIQFAWPSEWVAVDPGTISCDVSCKKALAALFTQYAKWKDEHPTEPIAPLKSAEFRPIKNKISTFLSSISNAHNRISQRAQGVAVNEAEMRDSIDAMANLFWGHSDAEASDSYFKEACIHLAQSQFHHGEFNNIEQSRVWARIVRNQTTGMSNMYPKVGADSLALANQRYKKAVARVASGVQNLAKYVSPHAKLSRIPKVPSTPPANKTHLTPQSSPTNSVRRDPLTNRSDREYPADLPKATTPPKAKTPSKKAERYQAIVDGLGTIRVSVDAEHVVCIISGFEHSYMITPTKKASKLRASGSIGINESRPSIFIKPKVSTPVNTTDCSCVSNPTKPIDITDPTSEESAHAECKFCPFITRHLDVEQEDITSALPYTQGEVDIPSTAFEFKRHVDEDAGVAIHQCQMYMVSILEFNAALGLSDFPVFGVVITGSRGTLMMAWKSTKYDSSNFASMKSFNIIFDQNLFSFDLTKPLEVYHFAIIIHRIYLWTQKKLAVNLAQAWNLPHILDHSMDALNTWAAKLPDKVEASML